jgi:hypothetical protein
MKAWSIPLSFLGIFSLSALAQETPPTASPPPPPALSPRQACEGDYHKFCAGVQKGGGRIVDCLTAHKDELTTACQEALPKAHPPAPKSDGAQAQPTK